MPIVELECASLHDGDSDRGTMGLRSAASYGDRSSSRSRARVQGMKQYHTRNDARSTKSEGHHASVNKALTNFTESLSHSTEGIQDGIQKTFSSIVNSFSRDAGSHTTSTGTGTGTGAGTGYSDSSSSSGYSTASRESHTKAFSEFVFPEQIRNRVSSLTSWSSTYNSISSHDSTLSSHSASPRADSDKFAITVDNAGFVLRESTDDSSSGDSSSGESWQDTHSRDRSLLDTIGESRDENDEESDGGSTSGSESGSESSYSGDEEGRDEEELAEESDGDSTAFDSDVGLEDLGAAMLQIGSCHFEPESASLSYDDEEYSYTSGMLPPAVSNYLDQQQKGSSNHTMRSKRNSHIDELQSEAARNAIFQKRLQQRHRKHPQEADDGIITSFLVSSHFSLSSV
jgi:hypothetical protein